MSLFSVLLALIGTADAANVVVPTQYGNLSEAVTVLASGALGGGAHTITVLQDGEYVEPGLVDIGGMDVTITGTGAGNTIIRSTNGGTGVFRVTSGRLVLDAMTVTGDVGPAGTGSGIDGSTCGFPDDLSGVEAFNATVEIIDSEFRCFFSQGPGAAINSENSALDVTGSTFDQNIAFGNGGHIFANGNVLAPPTVTVTDNNFVYGVTLAAGGAVSLGNVAAHVSDNDFRYNDSVTKGGAVHVNSGGSGTVELWNNLFLENMSLALIGYNIFDAVGNDDTGDQLAGEVNFAFLTGEGGGAYIESESVDVWANLFCGNIADDGAGLNVQDPISDSTIENNVFNDNWSLHYGGGAYLRADSDIQTPAVWNNTFYGNSAGQSPPGFETEIYVYGAGGGMMSDGAVLDFHNNIVAEQFFGGGVTGVHGADYIIGDPLMMQNNLWYGNCETDGCDPLTPDDNLHLAGDYAQHALNATNIRGEDPFPTYAGIGELDCYPDAFYARWGTASIDAGDDTDPSWRDIDQSTNDIGFTGGSRAPVLDRDNDGYKNTLDCNDINAFVNPGEPEICDDVDNNCDGQVNEGFIDVWYWDGDGDGYGSDVPIPGVVDVPVVVGCAQPAGYVAEGGDCDDADPAINPGAAEICDKADNDCNDIIDDEDVLPFIQYFEDADGDNFGDSNVQVSDCQPPAGYIEFGGDCDDTNDAINPNGAEVCNGEDDDCNGIPDDDASDAQEWYVDSDGDTYGSGVPTISCDAPGTGSFVNSGGDCVEGNADINPGAVEICDDLDNDCDGGIDVNPADGNKYYFDLDGDGLVDQATEVITCDDVAPEGMVEQAKGTEFDCDDADEFNACASECGCSVSAGPTGGAWLLALASLLVMRRRKA